MSIASVRKWSQRALGLYLTYHFFSLIPYAAEMFGLSSWLTVDHLPKFRFGIFAFVGSDAFATSYLLTLAIASILVTCNRLTTAAALYIWFGFVGLVSRNPFYYELTVDYLGWLCLALAVLPRIKDSEFPLFQRAAWVVLGFSYLASGVSKLGSPVWRSGDAIHQFYSSDILARFPVFTMNDSVSATIGWSTIALELLFLPAVFFRNTRMIAWSSSVLMHLGLAMTSQLTEISLAMLVFHLFLFEETWLEDVKWLKKKISAANS